MTTRTLDSVSLPAQPAGAGVAVLDPDVAVNQIPTRAVPAAPWRAIVIATLLLAGAGLAVWELQMRAVGLRAGDLDDSNDHWAIARRELVALSGGQIAIVGDSRIWFDTDLAVWRELTERDPVQLALEGTNGRFILADLGADEQFRGLVVVGMAELLYFNDIPGLRGDAVSRARTQSHAQRFGTGIHRSLSRYVAFLDQMYTPPRLLRSLDIPSRPGVITPRMMPWKLSETYDRRQTFMWPRVEHDVGWQEQTKQTWMGLVKFALPPVTDEIIDRVIADTVRDVRRIRARGGEVAFVRPPSSGGFLAEERSRLPRERGWDRLVAATGAVGVHWEDYPELQDVEIPEWSHLTRASATRFTRVYVDQLRRRVPWLQSRVNVAP